MSLDKIDQLEDRLNQLEHKAVIRKIWTDMWRKALPPGLFFIGSFMMMMSATDWSMRIAAVLFMCGSWLMFMTWM